MQQKKTMGPFSTIQFAGITLDFIHMEACLPVDKLQKCHNLQSEFLHKRSATLRDLQSLICLLNFACSVILPGRAFLRRLIGWFSRLWCCFWHSLVLWRLASSVAVYKHCHPLIISNGSCVTPLGSIYFQQCVILFTDNAALVDIINKQTSSDKGIMVLVCSLVLCCLRFNILFRSCHVPGFLNKKADYLPCFQVEEFKALAPDPYLFPTAVPEDLLPEKWSIT